MEQEQIILETILRAVVDQPDKVQVTRSMDTMGVLLTAKIGEGDEGRVIGKSGRSIKAIRSVINLVGRKNKSRVSIKLDVPEVPRSETAAATA